ncbi:MAG: aminotransferase class V-fold PLP-dependent enzyme [Ktedonobacteraceae bacterium]|nr:aminotransferase class V-fold PLP-dependent enzyme [Ktedonobacteraceae bacterium]
MLPDATHLQQIRQELPATRKQIYLNTGTFGPLPTFVMQVMQERIRTEWDDGRLGTQAFHDIADIYAQARMNTAKLINADLAEIALTESTGEGMNIVYSGFNWQAGDEVITTNHEHISMLLPLHQLSTRFGIIVRTADLGPRADRSVCEAIDALITEHTRLIALSHITWTTGTCLNVHAVTQLAHERHIPVLIDGAQSAGAIPIDVKALDVDFYALPMQKWLCGPDGTGALYVRQQSLHFVIPTFVGYWSVKDEESLEWVLHEHTQRFESGGRQTAALAGQGAALHWLEHTVGHSWLFENIKYLHTYAYVRLQQIPHLTVLTPEPGASGLLTFTLKNESEVDVVNQLRQQHLIQIRSIGNKKTLRLSTGFYNTEEEINSLAEALAELLKGS